MSMASCLKETYEVRTGKLRKEREELERRTSQVPKSSLLNPATLAVRLPALAAHIREWAQSAAGEDFPCLAQALDLRVIASRERGSSHRCSARFRVSSESEFSHHCTNMGITTCT